MNEMSSIKPDLVEAANVGNRLALLLPEGFGLPGEGPWIVGLFGNELRLKPYIEADWAWGHGLAGSMDEDWARAIEEGRIGPDHPDNALDDEPVFE